MTPEVKAIVDDVPWDKHTESYEFGRREFERIATRIEVAVLAPYKMRTETAWPHDEIRKEKITMEYVDTPTAGDSITVSRDLFERLADAAYTEINSLEHYNGAGYPKYQRQYDYAKNTYDEARAILDRPTPTAGMPSDEMMSKWWPGTKDGIPVESTVITKYVFDRILAGLEAAVRAECQAAQPKMTEEWYVIKKNVSAETFEILVNAVRNLYEKGETK